MKRYHLGGLSGGTNRERLRLVSRRVTRSAVWWRASVSTVVDTPCSALKFTVLRSSRSYTDLNSRSSSAQPLRLPPPPS